MSKKRKKKTNKKNLTLKGKIVSNIFLFILVLTIVLSLLLTLPQFKLEEIKVYDVIKIDEKEIIEKSSFEIDKNIFLQNFVKAEKEIKNIKTVKNVNISLNLPNKINIYIDERIETYQIKAIDGYYVLDEHGYILKKIEKRGKLPEILGIEAKFDDEIRLNASELLKLENINKIYNTAKILNLDGMITEIKLKNIGFEINFGASKKRAHFENINNLMNSMQFVREIVCSTENSNKSGDIYATEEGARSNFK